MPEINITIREMNDNLIQELQRWSEQQRAFSDSSLTNWLNSYDTNALFARAVERVAEEKKIKERNENRPIPDTW